MLQLGKLLENPVFAGLLCGALASGALMQLAKLPPLFWSWLRRRFSVTLTLNSSDYIYELVDLWLNKTKLADASRQLRLTQYYCDEKELWDWGFTLGYGLHMFWHQRRLFLVYRHIEAAVAGNQKRIEVLYLTTFGTTQAPLRGLVEGAKRFYDDDEKVRVYFWHKGAYTLADRKRKRAMSTIFIPQEQKKRLTGDLERFLGGKELYRQRGTPYRRGYLLEGPPGTGKTSLIFALASHLGKPVYIINLNNVGGDVGVQSAFNEAGSSGVVVIEDIDTVKISNTRDTQPLPTEKEREQLADQLTLSGLLNAIDGVAAREGRILFITSNHADVLDPALLRPGRVDMREYIGAIADPEARAMTTAFQPDAPDGWFDVEIAPHLPMSPADLQNRLLSVDIPTSHG